MTDQLTTPISKTDLTALMDLFGPPPVLSSESLDAYNALKDRLLACLCPEDVVVMILIRDFLNSEWEVLRLFRHKAMVPERRFRIRLEHQQIRANQLAARSKPSETSATAAERHFELQHIVDDTPQAVDKIFNEAASERDHAQGLETGILYYEQLDKLLQVAVVFRNDSLQQIKQYRADLGQNLQRVTEAAEAAINEGTPRVEADKSSEASLVPTEGEPQ